MPKSTIKPPRPSFRRTTVRRAVAEELSTERKTFQRKSEIKTRAMELLQRKSEQAAGLQQSAFPVRNRPDPVEQFRESRQDKFISSLSPTLNVMIQAVQKAGRGLVRDFGELEQLQISKKGAADFASTADLNSEKTLREYLLKVRPRYGFLQEESGVKAGDDTSHRWIVDPLDGTSNFLHAVPHFAISLALQEDNDIVAGVIFNPVTGDLFYAERGGGAWAMTASGSRRIHVSNRNTMNEAVVVTGIPHLGHSNPDRFVRQLMPMMQKTAGVRRMGAASLDLAYVAAGRFECYFEEDIKPWDVAAGQLIVKEAGGRVCTYDGKEDSVGIVNAGTIIASNDQLFTPFKKMLTLPEESDAFKQFERTLSPAPAKE